MSSRHEVKVPDIGDFDDVEVVEVMVKPGDEVAAEDPLITLETDKAAMDVPSPVAGKIVAVAVEAGGSIAAGGHIADIETEDEGAADAAGEGGESAAAASGDEAQASRASGGKEPRAQAAPTPRGTDADRASPGNLPAIDEATFSKAHASPSVRKFARELGVDLGRIRGSGRKGRVLHDDVKTFVKTALAEEGGAGGGTVLPELPRVDFTRFGPVEVKPLGRIQKISGPRLHASWLNYPHVTQFDEADISDLEARRQKLKETAAASGVKLTPLAFIIKAAVIALQEFPDFNTSMADDGENLVYKKYYHIGFAADTPNGLIVPVIRDANLKDLMSIAEELATLSAKGREGKLPAKDMQGGSFTVSSLGGIGGTHFTPIINAPEVAILGVGRADHRAVWQDDQFVPRLILPLSLSYDHRVIDGASGVRFTTFLRELLADPDRILLGSRGV